MTSEPRNILIAEDEAMIAMLVEDYLDQLGYAVAGSCATSGQCLSLVQSGQAVDAAILDCNLADGPVWPLARQLRDAGVPFLFASGDGHGIPEDLAHAPVLGKPYLMDALEQKLNQLFGA